MPETLHPAPKDPAFHKLPPQSIEAEESILSAILIDNSTLMDILEILSADDFYKTAHKITFAAIETLYAKSEPVDLVTLSNILREKDELEKIGGAAYLSSMVDALPDVANAGHYGEIVHDKSVKRRLIVAAQRILTTCSMDHGEAREAVESAQRDVYHIAEDTLGGGLLLNDYLSSLTAGDEKRLALQRLARWIRHIHSRQIWQRDFKSRNVLFHNGRYHMLDLDSVRLEPRIGTARRMMNLAQLNASVSNAITLKDRLRFFHFYIAGARWPRNRRRAAYQKIWEISRGKNTAGYDLDLDKLFKSKFSN